MDDVHGGNGSTKIHTLSQHNGLSSLINYNSYEDIEMNEDLSNGDVSCGNYFIKIHNIYQFNESSYFNDMDGDIENGNVSGGNCFMNSHTISEANNFISLD